MKTIAFAALLSAATALAACATTPLPPPPPTPIPAPTTHAAVPPPAPEPPAVRAEDLVELEALPANRLVLAGKTKELDVRVHLRAKPHQSATRPAINLGLVVDTSGSMEGSAIDDARSASLALLASLAEGDRLAVVAFHSRTEILVPSTVLTAKTIPEIRAKISAIKANGTTDLAGGLAAGLAEVARNFRSDGINRIVLLGDGVPNDPSRLHQLAAQAAGQRIGITALGLGLDYDETSMSKLALESGGKYHFIKDSSKVSEVFSGELLRLKEVVGRAMQVTVSPGPGVVVREILGLPASSAGTTTSVVLGDLSEGEERDVIVRLSVPNRAHAGSVVELLDVELTCDDPSKPGQRLTERAFVSAKATSENAAIEGGRERDVEHTVARLSVAEGIVRALALAREGKLASAFALLDATERLAKAAAKAFNDNELAERAKSIGPVRKTLPSLVPPPEPPAPLANGGGPPQPMRTAPPPVHVPPAVMQTQADAVRALQ